MPWRAVVVVAVLVALGLYGLHRLNPGVFDETGTWMRLIGVAMILVLVAPAAFSGRLSRNLRNLLIWAAILIAIALGYSQFQTGTDSVVSVRGTFMPQHDSSEIPGEARFRANRDGEFVVRALVDGTPVVFLVDTGATDVVLSETDARRLGIDPDALSFTRLYDTANGTVSGAPVRLGEISLGGVRVTAVRATVTDGGLNQSLLGLSFLNRLSGFEVRDGVLTLYR